MIVDFAHPCTWLPNAEGAALAVEAFLFCGRLVHVRTGWLLIDEIQYDGVRVARKGGRDADYVESRAVEAMKKPEFTVRAVLNRGKAEATVWTCDFSFDYVKINAEYRT